METSNFEEAEDAGTQNGHLCTLILADGDTTASIAVAGLSVVGRTRYGMYKLTNFTDEAMHRTISEMPEIVTLIDIVGLQYKADYSTEAQRKTLRYGKLMILTDQNEEGSCVKGLLINFIYTNWPSLLRQPFLEEFITPVVKATKGETKCSFFSLAAYEEWKMDTSDNCAYTVRYYRGLGTNSWNEAKEYFSNIDFHRVTFKYGGSEDDQSILKAFSQDALEQRREWLTRHMNECKGRKVLGLQDISLYTVKPESITFSEFINLEFVSFAIFDNVRSIPSIVDGLKPGHRKVLFTCIKRNDQRIIKVAQLTGCVAELAAYYQSERSLCDFIYDMAHNYVGSNNMNLLIPFGQFGTRLMGGKDCAEHYYIHTMMSPLTRLIFHPHDDPLLSHNFDDENNKIEPHWYVPIIPMLLVNGSEGTGTGWSTEIPKHCPHQLIRCLRNMIAGKEPEVLTPNYRNFRGTIHVVDDSRFITIGCLAIIDGDKIEISELPIGTWTVSYKESVLEPLLTIAIITDYKEHHTDTTVRFVISFAPNEFDKLRNETNGFHRMLKLYKIIETNNMHAFDGSNSLRRYVRTNEILTEFYDLRLDFYVKRKEYLEKKLTAEADQLSNQAKFILAIINHTLVVENKTREAIIDELTELGYQPDPVEAWKRGLETSDTDENEMDDLQNLSSEGKNDVSEYDYLLNLSMWMLTEERKNQLINRRDVKIAELNALKAKSEYDLWLSDLEDLERKLCELEEKDRTNLSNIVDRKDLHPSDDGKKVVFKITNEM